jgi:hypothetical protein
VTTDSVFDITIQLNSFASKTSWTWLNGALEYFSVSNGVMRVKAKAALTPKIDWTAYPNTGCTATPIRDCAVTNTTGNALSLNLVVSVDETLSNLAGSAFSTSGAIMGFLVPVFERGPTNPTINYQLSGAHFQADGITLQTGNLRAVLPLAKVQALFPEFTTQHPAEYFNVTRTGAAGSQDRITWGEWTVAAQGTEGITFDVTGVTFSSPTYVMQHNGVAAMLPSLFVIGLCALVALVFHA